MVENLPNVSELWQSKKFIVTVCFKNNFRKQEKQSWCLRLDASVICPAADHGTANVLVRVPALDASVCCKELVLCRASQARYCAGAVVMLLRSTASVGWDLCL